MSEHSPAEISVDDVTGTGSPACTFFRSLCYCTNQINGTESEVIGGSVLSSEPPLLEEVPVTKTEVEIGASKYESPYGVVYLMAQNDDLERLFCKAPLENLENVILACYPKEELPSWRYKAQGESLLKDYDRKQSKTYATILNFLKDAFKWGCTIEAVNMTFGQHDFRLGLYVLAKSAVLYSLKVPGTTMEVDKDLVHMFAVYNPLHDPFMAKKMNSELFLRKHDGKYCHCAIFA